MPYEVTIGIPVYNVEKYIRLTMDSALAQTFDNIEFLILDDCGTDKSMEIVRDYQQKHPRGNNIRIVRQPQNMGIGNGRNRIIEEARGKYLYYLDADDTIASNAIELLYNNIQRYNADIVYGSYERIELYGDVERKMECRYPSICFLKENEFAEHVYNDYGFLQANTWNFIIKLEIVRKWKLRFKSINFWEDFLFTMDLPVYINRAILLPDITYCYYCRNGSLSNFQQRSFINKSEIVDIVNAVKEIKNQSCSLRDKPYFPKRMNKIMMTCFYIVCNILRNSDVIFPSFSKEEMRDIMSSPLQLCEVISFHSKRMENMFFYFLGIIPSIISINIIMMIGKVKKLI